MVDACYVHVPFCNDICAYCDFTRCRYHHGLAQKWLMRIEEDIANSLTGIQLKTLYIGGGTPSALSNEQLERLFIALSCSTNDATEITMEANVESFTDEKMMICNQFGVHRISLGVQSLQPTLLAITNRMHTQKDVLDCIDRLHQYNIHDISIDLIYGLPTQTMQMWKEDIERVVSAFDITHISLYALSIEKNSRFGREQVENIDEQVEADMYEYAIHYLQQHGFHQYEISNFAKEGYESKHNQVYWRYEDFFGIGCGASGKEQHRRYDNTKNLQTYVTNGASPSYTELSMEEEMFETIMMSLRLNSGLCISAFEERYQVQFESYYQKPFRKNKEKGWLNIRDGHVQTTYQGMLMLHELLLDFFPEA